MALRGVYREFSGFTLIIVSCFLFWSVYTYLPQYPEQTLSLSAILSQIFLDSFGLGSFYLFILIFCVGLTFLLAPRDLEAIKVIIITNRFILLFASIFPFCLFISASELLSTFKPNEITNIYGGIVGSNLNQIFGGFLSKFWVSFLSVSSFVGLIVISTIGLFKRSAVEDVDQNISPPAVTEKPKLKTVEKVEKIISKPSKTSKKNEDKTREPEPQKEYLDFLDLLDKTIDDSSEVTKDYLDNLAFNLEEKLKEFGIEGSVADNLPGPVITRFELNLAPGTKASQVSNIANDLARSLAVKSVRVVEVIEGKSTIGIEIPNPKRKTVTLYSTLSEQNLEKQKPLEFCIGKDISGNSSTVDLQQLPHLLIAGTTGSGKSVGVNTILLNLLRKNSPADLKLLLIDPKMLELSVYDDIPHLLTPVITDMQKAANGLNWCVKEMDKRYKLMSLLGVRSLEGYNQKITNKASISEEIKAKLFEVDNSEPEKLPYVVVVVDELADLMMVTGKKVEQLIARLAQKARASGIHLVIATQRPSVDVITGLIRANIPSRISFLVSSKVDSRTILDQGGAEQLLGKGDMLFVEPGTSIPKRIHCSFVSDDEVQKITKQVRDSGTPNYIEEVTKSIEIQEKSGEEGDEDELYQQAVEFVIESRRASISSIQRKFRIGYNRAARLIETMEDNGIVSPMNSNGSREVL